MGVGWQSWAAAESPSFAACFHFQLGYSLLPIACRYLKPFGHPAFRTVSITSINPFVGALIHGKGLEQMEEHLRATEDTGCKEAGCRCCLHEAELHGIRAPSMYWACSLPKKAQHRNMEGSVSLASKQKCPYHEAVSQNWFRVPVWKTDWFDPLWVSERSPARALFAGFDDLFQKGFGRRMSQPLVPCFN